MKTICKYIILLFSLSIYSQTDSNNTTEYKIIKVKPNDRAYLKITDWVANIPKDKNLNNKFIILNFLKTKFIQHKTELENLKHLNELQSKFGNKDLYFITLTDEKPEIVKNYIQKLNFKSIVVSDQRKINTFWNGGMDKLLTPVTLLIDNNGIVKWIGGPESLDEKIITSFINSNLEPYDMWMYVRK